jgi:hypothetical protein
MYYYKSISPSAKANPALEQGIIDQYIPPTELLERFPNLKRLNFQLNATLLRKKIDYDQFLEQLCTLFQWETFIFHPFHITKLPDSLWTKHLRHLTCRGNENAVCPIQPPPDFDNHLETIHLYHQTNVSVHLFEGSHLKQVEIQGSSNFLSGLEKAVGLQKLSIYGFEGERLGFDPAPLTQLHDFLLQNCPKLQELPDFSTWKQLKVLALRYLPNLKTGRNHWDALESLESFQYNGIHLSEFNQLVFNRLPHLKTLEIDSLKGNKIMNFLGEMPVLEDFRVYASDVVTFAASACRSPHLKRLILQDCPRLTQLPSSLLSNEHIENIQLIKCKKLRVPKEILNMARLNHFHMAVSEEMIKTFKIYISEYSQYNVLDILKRRWYNAETRLSIGQLFIEGVKNWADFGDDFLKLLAVKEVLQSYVLENLHFLNPQQAKTPFSIAFQGQTIGLMPSVRGSKPTYRQKLTELGFKPQVSLKHDTNLVIVGDKPCELPTDFWKYPHYFFKETDLTTFIETYNPSFLQVESAQTEENLVENVRQLLWSANPDSERLAVELLKTGGVPRVLLPDLVLVAKDSDDPQVKVLIKKLIKGQLSVQESEILSDFRLGAYRMLQKAQWHAPNFDVAQMAVCFYERRKRGLSDFFELTQDRNHPAWRRMSDAMLDYNPETQSLSVSYSFLTAAELTLILDKPYLQTIKSLDFNYSDNTLPPILFEMSHLESLMIEFRGKIIPDEIGQLQQLIRLDLRGAYINTLPNSILHMKSLKSLHVHYVTTLPKDFEVLKTRLNYYNVGDRVQYI